MLALILSAVFLILMLSAFIFGLYYSAKKRKNGGCSGCSGCPSASIVNTPEAYTNGEACKVRCHRVN